MSESYVHGRCIEWCMFNWEDVYGISYLCEVLHEFPHEFPLITCDEFL